MRSCELVPRLNFCDADGRAHDVIDDVVRVDFVVGLLESFAFLLKACLNAFGLFDFAAQFFICFVFRRASDFDDKLIVAAGAKERFNFVFVALVGVGGNKSAL